MNYDIYLGKEEFKKRWPGMKTTFHNPSDVLCAFSQIGNLQYLVIRGTANTKNLFYDAMFWTKFALGMKFHRGFHKVAKKIFDDSYNIGIVKNKPLVITGHSLGGAIAVVLGLYMKHYGFNIQKVVTFGQPKVTYKKFLPKAQNILGDDYIRVVNESDEIPNVPTGIFGFFDYGHFGDEIAMHSETYDVVRYPVVRDHNFFSQFFIEKINDHHMGYYIRGIEKILGHQKCNYNEQGRLEQPIEE